MAAPVVALSTTFDDGGTNTTSRTINKPSGTVAGDWLVLVVAMDGSSGITPPSGFTTVLAFAEANGTFEVGVYKRLADGSEGSTFTIGSASEQGSGCCMRITGGDPTDIVDVLSSFNGVPCSTGGQVHCPQAWAECVDSLILRVGASDDGTNTLTDPAGTTTVCSNAGSGTAGTTLSIASTTQASAGYTGQAAFTASDPAEDHIGLTLVLRSTGTASAYPAQPVIRSISECCPVGTAALTYPKPYGTADGDLLYLTQSSDVASTLTPPGSFTVIQNTNSGAAAYHQAYYRIASGEGASYAGSNTTTAAKQGALYRIVGANTAIPINTSSVATGTSAAPTAGTITPTVNNCLLLWSMAADDDDATYDTGYPSGYTGVLAWDSDEGADSSSIFAFNTQTTAGATGSVAGSLAASEEWVAILAAIAPVPPAPPVPGPVVWMAADGIVGLSDGSSVAVWPDQSGHGSAAVQATGTAQPTYRTNVLNGGPVVRFDGSNDVLVAPLTADASITAFVVAKKNSAAQNLSKSLLGWGAAAVLFEANDWSWYPNQASAVVHLGGTVTDWTMMTLVFASNASCTPYLDGVAGTPFDPKDYDTQTTLRVGGVGTGFLDCDVAEILLYGTALGTSDREAVEAYLTTKYFSSSGYTLTADAGTVSLSGIVTGLRVARTLTAATRSYALTGTAANLNKGFRLTAATATFALAGNDADFPRTLRLAAVPASFSLGGNAANLLRGCRLVAEPGAFTLTGNDTALGRGYALLAGNSDVALTGIDAGLESGRRMTGGAGGFDLTGVDAELTYTPLGAYFLAAETGSLSLTGQNAGLEADRRMAGEAAGFALAGNDASLAYGPVESYTLAAGAGTFQLAGPAARVFAPSAARGGGWSPGWARRPTGKTLDQALRERDAAQRRELFGEPETIEQNAGPKVEAATPPTDSPGEVGARWEIERLTALSRLSDEREAAERTRTDRDTAAEAVALRRDTERLQRQATAAKNRARQEEEAFFLLLAA